MAVYFKLKPNDSFEAHEWAETIRVLQPIIDGHSADLPRGMTYAKAKATYEQAKRALEDYLQECGR
jgi:hypothetical protein